MPFALALSGWLGLLALAGTTGLFCFSGKLLIRAFEKVDSNSPQTYPALGTAVVPPPIWGVYIGSGLLVRTHSTSGNTLTALHTWGAGVAALGPKGRYIVAGFAVSEFFGGSCVMIIVLWQQLVVCLPHGGKMHGMWGGGIAHACITQCLQACCAVQPFWSTICTVLVLKHICAVVALS